MLERIRNSKLNKVFWGLICFYLLNISIDTPDRYPEFIPEDLTINDQESIIEFIFEQVLQIENAFEEYDDFDSKDKNLNKNIKIDLLTYFKIADNNNLNLSVSLLVYLIRQNSKLSDGYLQLTNPPPEA